MTLSTYDSGLLFTRAHNAVRDLVYAILEQYNLNPSYWAILGITVHSSEGVRLASVAKQMDVKAPLVTMLAGYLIEQGLIIRIPHHSDGRAKLLVATAKGKKMAEHIEALLSAEIERLIHGVSSQDIAAFQRTLETIIENSTS